MIVGRIGFFFVMVMSTYTITLKQGTHAKLSHQQELISLIVEGTSTRSRNDSISVMEARQRCVPSHRT